ncbi:hypothetical protein JM16_008167 [Phytophthora kernoviae]|uniref:Uncharacterized protein n=1 Tax=Phytophthora kernoviae TaxID=325452 RepID=A0A8T0LPC8_9STRA|nr:hypothetical protein JM16_008167 [Phytophthora kernoviae]
MEFLSNLSEEEQTKLLQNAMVKAGEYQERAQQARTQEGLIQKFKTMRAKVVRPGGMFADQMARENWECHAFQLNTDSKPNFDMKSLRSLKPMIINELEVGATHRGRYLCGWVAVDDAFFGIASSTLLIEDVMGYIVEVAVYGLFDSDIPLYERQHILASRFPKGQPIIVLEPYYKVRQDMTEGIRIDKAKEIISWRDVPTDLEAWKKLGNEFFSTLNTQNGGRGALGCYQRAIQVVQSDVNASKETKNADAWRKAGSKYFSKGDFHAAEECYMKGLTTTASCCRDVSRVLNNIAAVHLMLHRDTSDVPGISVGGVKMSSARSIGQVSSPEMAVLNCTVAGIFDPLNYNAWVRRARCLQIMGFSSEECVADLHTIRASVVTKMLLNSEWVQEFKHRIDTEIQRHSQQWANTKTVKKVSEVSTNVQREQRDAMHPDKLLSATLHKVSSTDNLLPDALNGDLEETIDQYIARMEAFENMMRFTFSAANFKASRQQKELPREMRMFVKNPPPQIHVEFPKLRGWPDGIDLAFARKVLFRAYLDASSNPWVPALSIRDGKFLENLDPAHFIKRWHGTGVMGVLRAKTLKFGDIIDAREAMSDAVPAYDARIRSNFANNPSRAEVYFIGSTHVAIGFNDFSSLLTAQLHNKPNSVAPLRFVGFEMSEFAVAKCKVVAQMLGSPSASILSVMEVWLSSTWSKTTLRDFRKSVNTVLVSLSGCNENAKVLSYLNHWASVDAISAAKARSEFFLNMERYNKKVLLAVYCFRRQIDGLDLAQYMLTGEIQASSKITKLMEKEEVGATTTSGSEVGKSAPKKNVKRDTGATTLVGSLTMWCVPPGAPPLEEDVALNTVDFMSLLEEYARREKKQKDSTDRLSVVDLFVILIIRNLHRLRGLMLTNKLTIEVIYGVVKAVRGDAANDPENEALLARIAMMRPYTISWSNVLDYFLPEDFHDLARRCSMHGDCMHYGYSMNWTTQVFGASIIDYDPKSCKAFIDKMLDTVLGFSNRSVSPFDQPLVSMMKAMGMDKLVTLPFREHPLNSTGYMLAETYKKNWIDHFTNKGQLTPKAAQRLGKLCTPTNCGLQTGTMGLSMPSPLYRTSLTLYMSWCYDPEMRLHAANNPFEVGAAMDIDVLADLMKHTSVEKKQQLWKELAKDFNF